MSESMATMPTAAAELTLDARPESLTQVVYEAIRDAIVNRTLPPGSRVTEAGLAERLNVSKTPVREALLKLREMGLVEADGRRGGRIVMPSLKALRHAHEVREALELWAVRRAAEERCPYSGARMLDAARRCLAAAQVGDDAGFRAWADAFHATVAGAPDNPRLGSLMEASLAVIETLGSRGARDAEFPLECAEAHIRIAHAVESGNADAAEAAMREHLRAVEFSVLASFGGDEAG
jgi:GntR family transcriptional regulator, rspAB operon transcriptional repressor